MAEESENRSINKTNKEHVAARFQHYTEQDHEDAGDKHYAMANKYPAGSAESQHHIRISGAHKDLANSKGWQTNKRKAKFGKSIACPECEAPMSREHAIKSLANLAKGQGNKLRPSMEKLVKGTGSKDLVCPSCVSSINPAYVIKSVSMLARQDGLDIQPALEGMFKSTSAAQQVHQQETQKSLFPVHNNNAVLNPFLVAPAQGDVALAQAIQQRGLLSQGGVSANVQPSQARSALSELGENQILGADYQAYDA